MLARRITMNRKTISGILKYSLTAISVLAFAMMMPIASTLAAPDCSDPKHQDKPACTGGDGEGSITYTALLTGAFRFESVNVYPNSRDNVLWSDVHLDVVRLLPADNDTWNTVFNTCPVLLAPNSVYDFDVVADDWFISKHGGVRVMFRDFLLDYDHENIHVDDGAVITVQLIGDYFDSKVENFLPVPGPKDGDEESSFFGLEQFVIWGETAHGVSGPRRACQLPGDGGGGGVTDWLPTPSTLWITATRHIP